MYNSAFFPWVVSHLSFIGWPVFFTVSYKLMMFIFKAGRTMTVVEQRVLKAEETIHLMATNHLPHLEMAINDTNKILTGIREDLRILMVKE